MSSQRTKRSSSDADFAADPRSRIVGMHWSHEQYVDEVNIEFLYKPHMLIALGVTIVVIAMLAFYVDSEANTTRENARLGAGVACFVFLMMGMLVFPSGPFIRPHPQFWRLSFGVGFMYLLFMVFLLFLSRDDARRIFLFFDSSLNQPLDEREYAADCSLKWHVIRGAVFDRYMLSHFFGWCAKALLLRDRKICWVISVTWEFVEIGFLHWLPNFRECWWDQWILDVLVCNGLGIELGVRICSYLEMRHQDWVGWRQTKGVTGKVKRVLLQFTPERWHHVEWHVTHSLQRLFAVQLMILAYEINELNAFMLKHVLWIPPECNLNLYRMILWFVIGLPATRQCYLYATDAKCKRLGTQAWMCIVLLVTEALVSYKFSTGLFTAAMAPETKRILQCAGAVYVVVVVSLCMKIVRAKKTDPGDSKKQE